MALSPRHPERRRGRARLWVSGPAKSTKGGRQSGTQNPRARTGA